MTAGPRSDESRLNGINSWSNSVLGQTEGKPYSSRIMRLFSNSKKGPVPVHSPAAESPASASSNDGGSSHQPWAGFSGLAVVDSFKKLRSSVLQGIQSKAAASNNGDHLQNKEMTNNGSAVNNTDETNLLKMDTEGNNVNSRHFTEQSSPTFSRCGSDVDDYDDEDIDVNVLTRNSRFSRSIRRAYGAGRIMLHDMEHGRRAGSSKNVTTVTTQEPHQAFKVQTLVENRNVKVLSKRSRSTENLPTFKLPVGSKAPCTGRPLQENTQRISLSNGTPNFLRTSSFSSVDIRRCTDCHRRSPVKNKTQMLKLIGSMTDLTVRRKHSPSSSPTSPSLMSPLSRLHDDYSRRAPCLQTNERQRRPLPIAVPFGSVEHNLLVHHQPENDGDVQSCPVVISPLPVEPAESALFSAGVPAQHEPLAPAKSYQRLNEGLSPSLSQNETSQHQDQTEDRSLSKEVRQQTVK